MTKHKQKKEWETDEKKERKKNKKVTRMIDWLIVSGRFFLKIKMPKMWV